MTGQFVKRIYLWDNLKFILILLVVVGHFADRYTDSNENMRLLYFIIYIFHMPAFFMVSGLFSKKTVKEQKWKKVFEYLWMFVAIKAVLTLTNRINGGNREFWPLDGQGIEWYVLALGAFIFLTILFRNLNKIYVLIFAVLIGCISGYNSADGDFLAISRIMTFYPFFFLGYIFDAEKIIKFVKNNYIKLASIVLLICMIVICTKYIDKLYWLRPLLTGRNSYEELARFSEWGGIIRLFYYATVSVIIFAIISIVPNIKMIISMWGSRTLNVYVLHYIFLYFFFGLLDGKNFVKIYFSNNPGMVLIPLSILLTIVLSLKIWIRPMNFLLKPHKK